MKVLVVDDDKIGRRILARTLEKLGYTVATASNGMEAWDILKSEYISLVICDWMMPEMDGLELCRRIRSREFPAYVFVILLTSKDSRTDIIEGMKAGADDFMNKPSSKGELSVRLRAGERILKLEKVLGDHNRKLIESNEKLGQAYSTIRKDLQSAARVQSSLLPKSNFILNGIRFDWLFLPAAYIAGDIFNYFRLDEDHIGFYLLDVAGHGIPSAMLSVTLSNVLSLRDDEDCILKKKIDGPPYYKITEPSQLVSTLNNRFQPSDDDMRYFTMIFGVIDKNNGRMTLTQAGHPPPICLRNDKEPILIGSGGFPVGMFPDLDYTEEEMNLKQGDRLVLYSDGITECINNNCEQFSTERLIELLEKEKDASSGELVKKVRQSLEQWKGDEIYEDDITLIVMDVL